MNGSVVWAVACVVITLLVCLTLMIAMVSIKQIEISRTRTEKKRDNGTHSGNGPLN